MTFEAARKKLPGVLIGSYDPLTHRTVSDLRYLACHELDLFYEGEETDIKTNRQLNQVRDFLSLCERQETGQ